VKNFVTAKCIKCIQTNTDLPGQRDHAIDQNRAAEQASTAAKTGWQSVRYRRRRSTAGTEIKFSGDVSYLTVRGLPRGVSEP
jgi:hypothetical protein